MRKLERINMIVWLEANVWYQELQQIAKSIHSVKR